MVILKIILKLRCCTNYVELTSTEADWRSPKRDGSCANSYIPWITCIRLASCTGMITSDHRALSLV